MKQEGNGNLTLTIARVRAAPILVLAMCFTNAASSATASGAAQSNSWNPKAAATYLDRRVDWWMSWPGATRDHGTFCISCHTALPYALSRPPLGAALGEKELAPAERRIWDNVIKRVRLWNETKPFYGEQVGAHKALQSRGTESVLNALILATLDARSGAISENSRAAFRNMWSLQETTGNDSGAWPWLDFGLEPFEASDSVFYGAALAAVAIGVAPDKYRESPEIQGYLKLTRDYLHRENARQSLSNQAVLLWASSKWPQLLSSKQQASIVDALLSTQHSDGGWSLSSLDWIWHGSSLKHLANLWYRSENAPLGGKSDGYATGMITYALKQNGLPRNNPQVQRAIDWLERNQGKSDGRWAGFSLNHPREQSPTGLFMSDAATAYAVLALTACEGH